MSAEPAGEVAAIPSDIWSTAHALYPGNEWNPDRVNVVARALFAERTKATEAAAQIANQMSRHNGDMARHGDVWHHGASDGQEEVADAIRNSLKSEGER
jgi:hypothetical protein